MMPRSLTEGPFSHLIPSKFSQANCGVGDGAGADRFRDCPMTIRAQIHITLAAMRIRSFILSNPPGLTWTTLTGKRWLKRSAARTEAQFSRYEPQKGTKN